MVRIPKSIRQGICALACVLPASVWACPTLSSFYPGDEPDWLGLSAQLSALMPECLRSSEYFALYGAAQLNSGQVAEASESLERALLLDPDNGAAQIDYAQALFEAGELFSAIALNQQILQRGDLPLSLQPGIQVRDENWRGLTRQLNFQADILAGYDSNLNGAPDAAQITLTLSGESVLLALNPEFRAKSGPYLNFRLGAAYRRLTPEHQHNWASELRGRFSEDNDSDLVQLDSVYSFIRPSARQSWQVDAGISNLFFGGDALYTATQGRARYQLASDNFCKPFYGFAAQHQIFHDQSQLNALEAKATAGLNCPFSSANANQRIGLDVSLLNNSALKSARPGGNRRGWQVNAEWQQESAMGIFLLQLNYTELDDRDGYSPILISGAERSIKRNYALLQYRKPLQINGATAALLVNLYHQRQRSNIELFETTDTTFEVGISLSF